MGGLLLAGTVFLSMTTACTASLKSCPYAMMDTHVSLKPLARKNYMVLGSVEGSAHCSGFFGGCIPDGGDKDRHFSGSLMPLFNIEARQQALRMSARPQGEGDAELDAPPMALNAVEQVALYNAMASRPDADGIINLIITKGTVTRIPIAFGYTEESVTVRATAIKIKNG